MSGGIDGELKDANVIYGVSIHNVRMGCSFGGEEGREWVSVPTLKVRNVQVHGKVTFFEFELEGLMCSFYLKGSGRSRTYFILHTE